jgi:hypothetical protein
VIVKPGLLCLACGGLCRLSKHTPRRPDTPSGMHVRITYQIQTPVAFRPSGLLLYPVSDETILDSLTIGTLEQLVESVPARLFQPRICIEQCELLLMQHMLSAIGIVPLLLPTMQVACTVRIVCNGPLTDFALPGVYLDETQELPRS